MKIKTRKNRNNNVKNKTKHQNYIFFSKPVSGIEWNKRKMWKLLFGKLQN
jgi:hypothetical protein